MHDELKARERVIAMQGNRSRFGPREVPEGTSPADLLLDQGTPSLPQRDRAAGGAGRDTEPAPAAAPPAPVQPVQPRGDEPGGGTESFDPECPDYKAFGWAGNKTLPSLILILKDGSSLGINYGDLASACRDGSVFLPSAPGSKGNVIRLRVAGDDGVFLVLLEGGRLWRVWELIMAHKTPWIRELPEGMDFVVGADPVIRSIIINPLKAAAAGGGR
jgi:hypothetical protein